MMRPDGGRAGGPLGAASHDRCLGALNWAPSLDVAGAARDAALAVLKASCSVRWLK